MATFRQRGKRWQAQVRRYGNFFSASFDTKASAERWARRIEGDLDQGKAMGAPRTAGTLGSLLESYEVESRKLRHLGRSSVDVLKQLNAGLGNLPLAKLTADKILAYCRDRRKRGAGPVTVGMDLSMLGTVLRASHALLGHRLSDLPVREAREALRNAKLVGKSQERDRIPTKDEIDALCAHWEGNERVRIPLPDFVRFAAASGMRREEISRLRWDDLDADAGVILIRDRKDPRRKAGNNQRVPLMFEALSIIQRQPRPEGAEFIFPLKAESVSTLFARACNTLKIADLRFHDLRHGAITRMFRSGMAIEEVAVVSGHRTWTQLKRYTHLRAEDLAEKYRPAEPPATDPAPPDDRTPPVQP